MILLPDKPTTYTFRSVGLNLKCERDGPNLIRIASEKRFVVLNTDEAAILQAWLNKVLP